MEGRSRVLISLNCCSRGLSSHIVGLFVGQPSRKSLYSGKGWGVHCEQSLFPLTAIAYWYQLHIDPSFEDIVQADTCAGTSMVVPTLEYACLMCGACARR